MQTAVYLSAGSSLLLGMLVLVGWYTHNTALIQVSPAFVPMQYNTALGFALAGLGFLALQLGATRWQKLAALAVLLVGVLTLIEYLFRVDLGVDQLFMEHYIGVKTSHPGRMAPNTALCFSLTGLSLLIAQARDRAPRRLAVINRQGSGYVLMMQPRITPLRSATPWQRMWTHCTISARSMPRPITWIVKNLA